MTIEKGLTVSVLDHGYVKYIDSMGEDSTVVEAARMSTGRGFISWEHYARCKKCGCVWKVFDYSVTPGDGKPSMSAQGNEFCKECDAAPLSKEIFEIYPTGDMGLLDNLWRHKHATPFEMVELAIEVQAPIMVFREWERHRTQSYNEFSARYAQMPDLHYLPEKERIQRQSSTNKQGSSGETHTDWHVEPSQVIAELERQQDDIYETYDAWVGNGIAKEVARLNTPVSRYSKLRAKTDLRNWLAFCNLRMRPGAQWEIRQYANIVGDIIKGLFPRIWGLFEEYDLYGTSFSRTEMKAIRTMLTSKFNGTEAAKDAGLDGTKLQEFLQKLDKGGKEIL